MEGPREGEAASSFSRFSTTSRSDFRCSASAPKTGSVRRFLVFRQREEGSLGREVGDSAGWGRAPARRSAKGAVVTSGKKKETYNIADSHVVTHRSTNATQSSLTTEFGMESGSFCLIWS